MKKIRITIEGRSALATLIDGEAGRDFASMLPLTLTLSDYSGTEKVGDLPRTLSTPGALSRYTPTAGDVAYYAPWGNRDLLPRLQTLGRTRRAGQDPCGNGDPEPPEPMSAKIELIEEAL